MPVGSAVCVDMGGPFVCRFLPPHAYYAAPVVGLRSSVLTVLSVRRVAKIFDGVISAVAIFVVDIVFRPVAVGKRENDAVSAEGPFPSVGCQLDPEVPRSVPRSGLFPGISAVPFSGHARSIAPPSPLALAGSTTNAAAR